LKLFCSWGWERCART